MMMKQAKQKQNKTVDRECTHLKGEGPTVNTLSQLHLYCWFSPDKLRDVYRDVVLGVIVVSGGRSVSMSITVRPGASGLINVGSKSIPQEKTNKHIIHHLRIIIKAHHHSSFIIHSSTTSELWGFCLYVICGVF